jgi:(p)ppGpp synthase/HD superfamily hydrolase
MEISDQEKMDALARYQKVSITLKSYLKGKGFHKALEAFEFGREKHSKLGTGFRKDGKTPNFQHQIEICLFLMTLKEVEDEETTLIAGLLHDVREDADVEDEVIANKFGRKAADAVEKLTKEFKGVKKSSEDYFDKLATCPIASLVKLADRIHNFSSMVGVFTIPKQEHYVFEVKTYFYPLIKKARNNFPHQHMSYHGMGTFLKNMCKTVEAVLVAEKQLILLKEKHEVGADFDNILEKSTKTTALKK